MPPSVVCGSGAREAGSSGGAGSGDRGSGGLGSGELGSGRWEGGPLLTTDSNSSSVDGDGSRMCEMWSGIDNVLVPGSNPNHNP